LIEIGIKTRDKDKEIDIEIGINQKPSIDVGNLVLEAV